MGYLILTNFITVATRKQRDAYLIEEFHGTCFFDITLEQFPDDKSELLLIEKAVKYISTILETCKENPSNYDQDRIFDPELSTYQLKICNCVEFADKSRNIINSANSDSEYQFLANNLWETLNEFKVISKEL